MWSGRMPDNKDLVSTLQKNGRITSQKVADAMDQIDRGIFVPPGEPSYMDHPVPIGYNATISAPHMHAICLELLKDHLQPGMHALDIGAGTGYLTAIFALMVGDTGRSVGVEHIPELTATAVANVQKSNAARLLNIGSLSLHTGDGRDGFPEHAPYDAIHVGAAAPSIPPALTDQLKPGGRLVIPVGEVFQELIVIDKDLKGELKKSEHLSVRYVPLTDRQSQLNKKL
ncbi:hypothetical protein M758_3G113800 [Ceratodon purpureus]|uniref:Protein-L-isoaspartate O-methyltransferase n=1 Tax=Ceratodon purpureus TaxID=3225 RepID=A0A8T0IJY4_CERPU|nr:hypothetical protein KC19_3G112500 [Ceratodon purpureus]KAG0622650.1 hypothetical protein M758_3G113800 [Ceratodon purpureus]